ncbi:DDB1- and CUL4-associated factor 8-like, partial [Trifolium medium]|nr:DDB1- and CUL4-associated factor 8-like [Trifolium medium]
MKLCFVSNVLNATSFTFKVAKNAPSYKMSNNMRRVKVRLGLVQEDGRVNTTMLGKHHGSVYKLAVEPGSPHIFYSCGVDGFIQHFDLRSSSATKLFRCSSSIGNKKQPSRKVGLNSIVIDSRIPYYFAVGGSDE